MKHLEDKIDRTKQLNGHVYFVILWCTHKISRQIISLRSLALCAKLAVFPLTCFENYNVGRLSSSCPKRVGPYFEQVSFTNA